MSNSDQDYESHILKIAINKYLDQKLTNSQKDLERIELNKDEFVWDVITTIYNQSGYKVSITFARDIIDQRIVKIKDQLREAEEKAHLEMMRIKAEQETKKNKAEQQKENGKIKIEKQRDCVNFYENLPEELKIDETKLDIFLRIQTIICERLEVEPMDAHWNSHLSDDLGADTVDLIELVMELEEEFEIEISDAEAEEVFYSGESNSIDKNDTVDNSYSPYKKSTGGFLEGLISLMAVSSAYSSSGYSNDRGGRNCIIKNIVNLVYQKL